MNNEQCTSGYDKLEGFVLREPKNIAPRVNVRIVPQINVMMTLEPEGEYDKCPDCGYELELSPSLFETFVYIMSCPMCGYHHNKYVLDY